MSDTGEDLVWFASCIQTGTNCRMKGRGDTEEEALQAMRNACGAYGPAYGTIQTYAYKRKDCENA